VFTFELLIQSTSTGDTEGANKLLKIDCTILVLIEDIEDIVSEFTRIPKREELLVYSTKFDLV